MIKHSRCSCFALNSDWSVFHFVHFTFHCSFFYVDADDFVNHVFSDLCDVFDGGFCCAEAEILQESQDVLRFKQRHAVCDFCADIDF